MGNRTSAGRTDGSQVGYGYDNVGQLTGAVGTESGGLLRGNENLGYVYDPAGNLFQRTNNTLVQTCTTDGANELLNITRNTDLLTVAGSLSSAPTSLTINGQAASVYGELTYAATNGVPIVNGLNQFTAVLNGTLMPAFAVRGNCQTYGKRLSYAHESSAVPGLVGRPDG